jgi:hypothetical protein
MRRDFIRAVQRKVAITAIAPSALRGQRHPGLIQLVRDFLSSVPLKRFGVAGASRFEVRLDECTEELLSGWPRTVRHWGVARKAVNLFLRDSFYNVYLRKRYELAQAEANYEIPLDEVVAKGLARFAPGALPPWRGVKYLTTGLSQSYQQAASSQAQRMGIARVHLDIYLWTTRPDVNSPGHE